MRVRTLVFSLLAGLALLSAGAMPVQAAQRAGVLGRQSAPVISQLPSTSTTEEAGGLAVGLVAIAAGLAMLRRRPVTS